MKKIIEFLAISWNEPWEFDYPTVVLKPFIAYSPNGNHPEQMIEDMAIDISSGDELKDENVSEEFNWRGWHLKTLRKVCKDRLSGIPRWKSKIREVIKQEIEFDDQTGEFKILKIEKA